MPGLNTGSEDWINIMIHIKTRLSAMWHLHHRTNLTCLLTYLQCPSSKNDLPFPANQSDNTTSKPQTGANTLHSLPFIPQLLLTLIVLPNPWRMASW